MEIKINIYMLQSSYIVLLKIYIELRNRVSIQKPSYEVVIYRVKIQVVIEFNAHKTFHWHIVPKKT